MTGITGDGTAGNSANNNSANTSASNTGIEIERDIAAPPAAVFTALTTAESFAKWFGGRGVGIPVDRLDYRAEAGRAWSAVMELPDGSTIDWAGRFTEVTVPLRLAMTITDQPGAETGAQLTFDLMATDSGTRLRMTQQTPGFSREQQRATIAGWEGFLDVLEEITVA